MNYGGGLTYRQPYGSGLARRRLGRRPLPSRGETVGASGTYRMPYGAGAADSVVAPLAEGDIATAAVNIGGFALAMLAQYYVIKWAVRAARKG